MNAAAAGELRLREHRHARGGCDETVFQGCNQHMPARRCSERVGIAVQAQRHLFGPQGVSEPRRRAVALGRHHHDRRCRTDDQATKLAHQARGVAGGRQPRLGLDMRAWRAIRCGCSGGVHRPNGRGAAGEQPVERHMQPRERRPVVIIHVVVGATQAPSDGQRAGEVVGLSGDVSGAVSEPTRLAEQHQRLGAEQVRQHHFIRSEPRQPRLHPVEQLATSQAFHVLSAPRLAACQSRSASAHGRVGTHFACRIQARLGEISHRALICHRELGETVHLVAPQVDADGRVGGGAEHVHDPAAHRHLAAVLHLMLAPVAPRHHLRHHLAEIAPVASGHAQRPRLVGADIRAQPLQQRPDGRNDHLRRRHTERSISSARALPGACLHSRRLRPGARCRLGSHAAQGLEHGEPSAHRLRCRAHAFERQRLPSAEERHLLLAEPSAQVIGEALGFVRRGSHHQDRRPRPQRGQARGHERPGAGGNSDRAGAAAQHRHEARVVAEALGQRTQRRCVGHAHHAGR